MLKAAAREIRNKFGEFGSKLKVKSVADVGSLEKIVPQKYYNRAQKSISNMPEKQRWEVTEYIEVLYQKHGDPRKTMQEHHWIEQSRIKDTKTYPFLSCPPMNEDLLKSKTNLSLIVGHNGGHKNTYNRLLDDKLNYIADFLRQMSKDTGIPVSDLLKKEDVKIEINNHVGQIIIDLSNSVKKDYTIMNNAEKIFILD